MKPFIIVCLLLVPLVCCVNAQAGDFKDLTQTLKNPVLLHDGASPRMAVTFHHASHKGIKCGFCHHMKPEGAKRAYASCGAGEGCHVQMGKSKDSMSLFMAYHSKDSQRSCYGCHHTLAGKYPEFKGCRPCHMPKPAAQ